MIFEMTRDYTVIVPLMIANLTSLFIARRFQKEPIYEALAHQDGIHLPTRETLHGPCLHTVSQVMQTTPQVLAADLTVSQALTQIRPAPLRIWPVAEKDDFLGILSREKLELALTNGEGQKPLLELVHQQDFPHVHADHPLHLALERMNTYHLDLLPVTHRADAHKLLGVITLRDLLNSYGVNQLPPQPPALPTQKP
jgi:CIC family chloride channel protein